MYPWCMPFKSKMSWKRKVSKKSTKVIIPFCFVGNHQLIVKTEITEDFKKSEIKEEVKKTVKPPKTKTVKVKNPTINIIMDKGLFKPIKTSRSTPVFEKDKHCNNFEVVLAHSTATPIRNHNGFAYTCIFCAEHFKYPADLKTHTLMKHTSDDRRKFMKTQTSGGFLLKLDITLLKCNLCNKSIDTIEGLFDHLQNEHKKLIYTDIKNQMIPFKFDGEELKCAICPRVFTTYKVLLEHMRTHYRNYVCEICDHGCFNRKLMLTHKKSHKIGSFECSTCNKVFETLEKMRQHSYTIHKFKSMPAKCTVCNERFKSFPIKDQHMISVHGMTPVVRKCLACDRIFPTQFALRRHTKKDHLMERNYKCKECEMKFFSKEQLKFHMLKHTGQKDFQCDVCLKWFTRKYVLSEHVRIHNNDRRFTCLQCGRGFVQKCSWRGHMRTVHGETDNSVLY